MGTKNIRWIWLTGLVFVVALAGSYLDSAPSAAEARPQTQIIKDITPQEAHTLIQKHKNNRTFVILDVRTPAEFGGGHIAGAVNLDYYTPTFNDDLNALDKTRAYLIYCRTARRSRAALEKMRDFGFREVYHMLGGIVRWEAEGLPMSK